MNYCLPAVLILLLLTACNRNNDEMPVCQLSGNPQYLYLSPYNMQLPNAFTPNGDGRNDRYRPAGITSQVREYKLSILDKDGSTLYETTDMATTGWDGRNRDGSAAAPGRYVAKIYYKTEYGEIINDNFCIGLLSYGGAQCIPKSVDGTYYFEDMYDPGQQGFRFVTGESFCP